MSFILGRLMQYTMKEGVDAGLHTSSQKLEVPVWFAISTYQTIYLKKSNLVSRVKSQVTCIVWMVCIILTYVTFLATNIDWARPYLCIFINVLSNSYTTTALFADCSLKMMCGHAKSESVKWPYSGYINGKPADFLHSYWSAFDPLCTAFLIFQIRPVIAELWLIIVLYMHCPFLCLPGLISTHAFEVCSSTGLQACEHIMIHIKYQWFVMHIISCQKCPTIYRARVDAYI